MATYINPGLDASGNNNTWTVNNINYTSSGSTFDTMTDVPTLTSATASNFAVMNPLNTLATLSSANLKVTNSAASNQGSKATFLFPTTGLFYCECVVAETTTGTKQVAFGLGTPSVALNISTSTANSWGLAASDVSFIIRNGSQSSTLGFGVFTAGTVLQLAVDLANSRAWLGINNTWYNSTTGTDGNPSAGTNPTLTSLPSEVYPFVFALYQNSCDINFGQRPFVYTPPTGFLRLNTFNLPTPTIGATASTTANKYMDATLYTGIGSSQTVVNSGSMQPDLVWIKNRTSATNNYLVDSVRGTGKALFSNLTNSESTDTNTVSAFNSNGFSLNGTASNINDTGNNYVAWQWRANGTGVSNTSGSITSTVSANTNAGFSVVTYTGNGTGGATIGHGLGVAPRVIILKRRNGTSNWTFGHSSLPSWDYYLVLNTTDAQGSNIVVWNNTAPTSSVFTVGTGADQNGSGNTIVAYCFSEVAGYSKFGSYTGNGSTDGPFVYLGFRPRYVMFKQTSASGNDWTVWDTARNLFNITNLVLYPNSSSVENAATGMDLVSNGIKLRDTGTSVNANGATYIYMAFAESPFKYANAR